MVFKVTTYLPDDLAQMPSFEIDTDDPYIDLGEILDAEFYDDYDNPMPVGTTLTVERVS